MKEQYSAEVQAASETISRRLIDSSVRPVFEPAAITDAVGKSLHHGAPLRLRTVLCPNWYVGEKGRTLREIPVRSEGTQLIIDEPQMNVVGFAHEELPGLISQLNRQGLRTELLVVLADILSPGWVHDQERAKAAMAQNLKALKMLTMSGEKGREVFGDKSKNTIKVASQFNLARETQDYDASFSHAQLQALNMGTLENQWYLHVLKELQTMNEYGDKRTSVSGMSKVWERALFLSTAYAVDGLLIEGDFDRARFPNHGVQQGYIELGAVASPHGDLIAQGLNILRGPEDHVGSVTPFNNAMHHSWSEPRQSPNEYTSAL